MTRSLILPFLLFASATAAAADPVAIGSRRELFVDDALVEPLGRQGRFAIASADATKRGGDDQRALGRKRHQLRHRVSGWRQVSDVLSRQPLFLSRRKRPPEHPRSLLLRRKRGRYPLDETRTGTIRLERFEAEQHRLGRRGCARVPPFRDTNPHCPPEAAYKALGVGGSQHGLYAFQSPDGLHWTLIKPEPIITLGAFDSLNIAFWDSECGVYREYHRDFRDGRDIRTSTSPDFVNWTEPEYLTYVAQVDSSRTNDDPVDVKDPVGASYPFGRVSELYTNQIAPYYRAPHLLLGFPTRYIDRGWTESAKLLPRFDYRQVRAKGSTREGTAVTDGMFICSRDRKQFTVWPESFVRPGLRTRDSWFYGDTYQNWGLVETKSAIEDGPAELSLYVTERTLQETGAVLRRYSLRMDGFVSLHAPLVGGELLTKPITFAGNQLTLNVSTSAAGSVRIEIQNSEGQAIPGFALDDCHEVYGDDLERTVSWKGNPDLGALAGQTVRLRFEVKDADVYSFRFQQR